MLSYMFPKLASIPCVLSSGMTVPIDKERKLKRKSTNSLPSEDHTLTIFVYKELQAYLIGCHVWFVNGSTMSIAFFWLGCYLFIWNSLWEKPTFATQFIGTRES